MYASAAQYNSPPTYPVTSICDAINGASSGSGILGKIAAGLFAYMGNLTCYINEPTTAPETTSGSETDVGWTWQVKFFLKKIVCEK